MATRHPIMKPAKLPRHKSYRTIVKKSSDLFLHTSNQLQEFFSVLLCFSTKQKCPNHLSPQEAKRVFSVTSILCLLWNVHLEPSLGLQWSLARYVKAYTLEGTGHLVSMTSGDLGTLCQATPSHPAHPHGTNFLDLTVVRENHWVKGTNLMEFFFWCILKLRVGISK